MFMLIAFIIVVVIILILLALANSTKGGGPEYGMGILFTLFILFIVAIILFIGIFCEICIYNHYDKQYTLREQKNSNMEVIEHL